MVKAEMTAQNAQELNRIYQREWRAKNKDKVRKYNQTYWERRLEKLKKEQRENG